MYSIFLLKIESLSFFGGFSIYEQPNSEIFFSLIKPLIFEIYMKRKLTLTQNHDIGTLKLHGVHADRTCNQKT